MLDTQLSTKSIPSLIVAEETTSEETLGAQINNAQNVDRKPTQNPNKTQPGYFTRFWRAISRCLCCYSRRKSDTSLGEQIASVSNVNNLPSQNVNKPSKAKQNLLVRFWRAILSCFCCCSKAKDISEERSQPEQQTNQKQLTPAEELANLKEHKQSLEKKLEASERIITRTQKRIDDLTRISTELKIEELGVLALAPIESATSLIPVNQRLLDQELRNKQSLEIDLSVVNLQITMKEDFIAGKVS